MSTRTWEDNADEFGALTKQGVDVRLAALVACSVQQGVTIVTPEGKSSIKAFAKEAKSTMPRVKRHLDAWEKCAAEGWCKSSTDLTPDDVNTTKVPTQEQFTSLFDATASGGRPRDSKPEDAVQIIEKRGADEVVAQMTPQQRTVVAEAIRTAERTDSELAAIARGGRVPSLEEINAGAGEHPLDGLRARAISFNSFIGHLDKALEILRTDLVTLNEDEKSTLQSKLLAFMDTGAEVQS